MIYSRCSCQQLIVILGFVLEKNKLSILSLKKGARCFVCEQLKVCTYVKKNLINVWYQSPADFLAILGVAFELGAE